ncbi:hypothetical protein AFLA70_118g002580 [Aspergillus flavus AF70]|nr:hypothetical protein AFLA70_118g002580 [Aspergillus flavus AF70]
MAVGYVSQEMVTWDHMFSTRPHICLLFNCSCSLRHPTCARIISLIRFNWNLECRVRALKH